jgi:carboxyl-terminal processing protease
MTQFRWLTCLPLLAALALAQEESAPEAFEAGTLFGKVSEALQKSYYDKAFRTEELPAGVVEFAPGAAAADDLDAERRVVDAFLAKIPASHLALLETGVHKAMMDNLMNKKHPGLGMQVHRDGEKFFVYRIYEKGPATQAGVRRGDRVLEVDGVPIARSPLLAGSSDDAALDDLPLHGFRVEDGQEVRLRIERRAGERLDVTVRARPTRDLDASRESARLIESDDGRKIGYVHLWSITVTGCAELVRELIQGRFAECDALVLDLRGRGGSAMVVGQISAIFQGKRAIFDRPVVALVDHCTRSAKEAISRDFRNKGIARLVGERTAGALLPASFRNVGQGYVLMYPAMAMGELSRDVEGKGIEPDVVVADRVDYAAGADPILEAGLREARRLTID